MRMIKQGRLTLEGSERRDQVEEVLAMIWRATRELEEVDMRIGQATRRSPAVVDVLTPAGESVQDVRDMLVRAKTALGAYWAEQQTNRWKQA